MSNTQSLVDDILRSTMQTGPTSPYGPGFMPQHLAIRESPSAMAFPRSTSTSLFPRSLRIPNVGGSVPLAGTPVGFPTRGAAAAATSPIAAAEGLGRLAGFSGRVGESVGQSPIARLGRSGLVRGVARSPMLRSTALGIAAELGGTALGQAISGGAEDTAGFGRADVGQFVTGAARGGALGALAGPWGAAGGALIGGTVGAFDVLGDVFSGGGEDSAVSDVLSNPGDALDKAMVRVGIDADTKSAIRETTLAQLELATTDAEKMAVLQNASAVIQQEALAKDEAQRQLAHSLAMQAQAAQIFEPYAEANQRNADMARVLFDNASQGLPESQRYLAAQFALGAQQQSDMLTQNMMTSAMAQPRLDALVAQQQQIDSVAAQIVQQATAAAMGGGMGGGGGLDVEALLAQAGV